MHLGNVFTALLSWLSVKKEGGVWVLRIEDLDEQRSKRAYAEQIEDDLLWLGLDWDEGGLQNRGDFGPYSQSQRHDIYEGYLAKLHSTGYVYPCTCRRKDILATQAPHQSDGRIVYGGKCRPPKLPAPFCPNGADTFSERIYVPDREIAFRDIVMGEQSFNLARNCGDFIVRRADGAWAYQLAVVVDDALMGINEVARGSDLLESAAQQIYLYELLGLDTPQFMHLPLLCNEEGRRLSKRDGDLDMGALRNHYSPAQLIGKLAHLAGLQPDDSPISATELIPLFDVRQIPSTMQLTVRRENW